MKIIINIALVLLLSVTTANAEEQIKCNPDGNQMELTQCAVDEFHASDKKLNDTWKKLMVKFKDDKTATAKLKAAQNAWIVFRDAEVAAIFACDDESGKCWGSIAGQLHNNVLKELTDARTERLQTYIDKGLGVPLN